MIEAWEIFIILIESDSDVHVELGDDARYEVKGEGIVTFHLKSWGSLDAHDVLYIPGLKKNFILVLAMEERVFSINFQRGKVLIFLEKSRLVL